MSRRLLPLSLLLAACTTTGTPASSGPMTPRLAIAHDSVGAAYALPGAAIEHEGTVHLWIVLATGEEGARQRVAHLVSTDLQSWEGDTAASVLDGGALGFDAVGPVPSSVLVEADGTWRMFGGGRLADGDAPILWTATAPGADGPWSFHPAPILQREADAWDGVVADHPSVVRIDDGYLMAYGGASALAPNRNRIGFASSPDGIRWERVASTLDGADDERALGPAACGIDARTMVEPELRTTESGLRLDFGAIRAGGDQMVIGTALSTDGSTWTCATDGPILEPADFDGSPDLHSFLSLAAGGRDLFLVELLGAEARFSDLWLVER